MFVARFVKCLLCFIFLTSQAFAQSYRCELRENGYDMAFSQMNPNVSRKEILKFFESWLPSIFVVTPEKLMLWKDYHIDITGGDREKRFQASTRSKSGRTHLAYDIKIEPYSGNGMVFLNPIGPSDMFKRIGPMRYSCSSIGNYNYKKSSVSNPFRQEFIKLSSCNKRYVQQFLKGQNFYNGAIDGLWGAGTEEGLRRAKNLTAFKNLTTAKMFEKLRLNPICN